jgi:hypothetical protein
MYVESDRRQAADLHETKFLCMSAVYIRTDVNASTYMRAVYRSLAQAPPQLYQYIRRCVHDVCGCVGARCWDRGSYHVI